MLKSKQVVNLIPLVLLAIYYFVITPLVENFTFRLVYLAIAIAISGYSIYKNKTISKTQKKVLILILTLTALLFAYFLYA